jgi:phospholipid/cholesterol/gamma-HCH transport system ATP-binding protein
LSAAALRQKHIIAANYRLGNPAAGSIKVLGEELTTLHGKKRLQLLRKFGVLFQLSGLLASMTLAENISLALENIKRLQLDLKKRIIDLKLSAVGLAGFERVFTVGISGGMKKRAALARAMQRPTYSMLRRAFVWTRPGYLCRAG